MNEMRIEILDLLILALLGILYLYTYARMKQFYMAKLSSHSNDAVRVIFLGGIAAAGVNLYHISDAASDAVMFFLKANDIIFALIYAFSFFLGIWAFSLLFFRFSFVFIAFLTRENEVEEIQKNNTEIAWLHIIILIALSFVIAPALVKIAVNFIPYPKMPF